MKSSFLISISSLIVNGSDLSLLENGELALEGRFFPPNGKLQLQRVQVRCHILDDFQAYCLGLLSLWHRYPHSPFVRLSFCLKSVALNSTSFCHNSCCNLGAFQDTLIKSPSNIYMLTVLFHIKFKFFVPNKHNYRRQRDSSLKRYPYPNPRNLLICHLM